MRMPVVFIRALLAIPLVAAAPSPTVVALSGGTEVLVSIPQTFSPDRVKTGDMIQLTVASSVSIGGVAVVRKGARGQCALTLSQRNDILMHRCWVAAVDGQRIVLSPDKTPDPNDLDTYLVLGPREQQAPFAFYTAKDVRVNP